MTTVLGVDPGGTTGACLIEWTGVLPLDSDSVTVLGYWELPFLDVPAWGQEILPQVDHLAIEKFLLTPQTVKNTREYEALYVIGGLIFLAALGGGRLESMNLRQASVVKTAWGSARLRRTGLHGSVTGGHARDALRHALFACQNI